MKNLRKFLTLIILTLLAVFNVQAQQVKALDKSKDFALNGETIYGSITSDKDEDIYKITLNKSGRVTLKFTSYIKSVNIYLLSSDETTEIEDSYIYGGSSNSPKGEDLVLDLESGIYYLKIQKDWDYIGDYKVLGTFAPSNSNESEPNNKVESAEGLKLDGVFRNGFLSYGDEQDFYKFTTDSAGRVTLNLTSYMEHIDYEVFQEDGTTSIGYGSIYDGSESNPKSDLLNLDLEAGTYYIKISDTYYTGIYKLKGSFKAANNIDIEPNDTPSNSTTLKLDGKVNTGFLTLNDKQDVYKFTTDKAGKVSLTLTTYMNQLDYDVLDKDGVRVLSSGYVFDGSDINPSFETINLNLEKGTYYLRIKKANSSTGIYKMKGSFTAANNSDVEPNGTISTAGVLNLDGKLKTGFLSIDDETDFYKITTQSAGRINLDLYFYMEYIGYEILDADGIKIISPYDMYGGTETSPKIQNITIDLEKGTYYLKIKKSSKCTGVYKIKGSFKAANNSDTKSNNTINSAQSLTINGKEFRGFLGVLEQNDFYKVTLSKKGYLTMAINSYKEARYLNVTIYKSDKVTQLESATLYWDTDYLYKELDKGTYYIKITKKSDYSDYYTGIYGLNLGFISEQTINNTINDKTTAVSGSTDPYNRIELTIGKKVYTATATATGKYLVTIPLTTKGTLIDFRIYDTNKCYYTWKEITVTGSVPAKPTVSAVNNKATTITGKTEGNITVYAKIGSKTYTTTSDAKGNFKFTIPVQNFNTVITITAKNKSGTSSATNVTVTAAAPNKPTVNAVTNKATTITGKTEAKITVYAKIGSKTYTTTSDSKGNFKFTIPVQNSGTSIVVTAKNKKGTSVSNTIKVSVAAPNKPTVNAVTNKATTITGKTEAKITVYAKIGSKTYTTTSDSKGNFKFTIPVQNSGTSIVVTAKNKKGTSVANTIKVSVAAPNKPTVNTVTNKATTITGKTEAKITVYAKIGSKTYTTTSDSKGNFKFTIPVQNSGTSIVVTAKNKKGTSVANTIKVSSVAPNKAVVGTIKSSATKITGKAEKNTTVYSKIGNKTYSAKTNSKGQFTITIPKQKVNTKISITVKDTKKKESVATVVSVVK